ncbi:unnamed protein product [Didymodactylos carnosus]|uniref:Phosphosulfolactate synthase n=1 Tax=Didymodactylos carnosus TaxID=1234261 RepID=A0A813ZJL3_9BILA|nr:unnamed protein product [Didymodactylos carnosus]CAF3682086.1 unnamed protein product [Didymodactylos carnosus]
MFRSLSPRIAFFVQTIRTLSSSSKQQSSNHVETYELPQNEFSTFITANPRQKKPRKTGQTEIRAAYYSVMGKRYLEDILETMGVYVDSLKFAGGAFTLYPQKALHEVIELAHSHGVKVSTGGFIERILSYGGGTGYKNAESMVDKYLKTCKNVGFDIVELSAGFISISPDDWLRLIEKTSSYGLIPKPELGISWGAGGGVDENALQIQSSPERLISQGKLFLKHDVPLLMIESEGITENVEPNKWRTDVISRIINELGADNVMFEAAEPDVFTWFIQNYGIDINLFVDHSQIVQLECLRQGIWGSSNTFARILIYTFNGLIITKFSLLTSSYHEYIVKGHLSKKNVLVTATLIYFC